jgi:enolase-phosphatase E1
MSAILLDIEGTVTDKRFVTERLFPFARARIAAFVCERASEPGVAKAIDAMRAKIGANASVNEIGAELERWIDADKKEEPLKSLQGLIWAAGYEDGSLVAPLYADVPAALRRWRAAGNKIAIFSSGSVKAQKLLFSHTEAGDLTPLLDAYFDLSTGPKNQAASYVTIAKALDCQPSEVRFYSDAPAEVEAAMQAGMRATLVERDGPVDAPTLRHIQDFAGE